MSQTPSESNTPRPGRESGAGDSNVAPLPSIAQVSRPFFTASELKYLHSQTIPESKKPIYLQRKHQVFQFSFQVIRNLKFPLRVLATTMNYYQRFYLFNLVEDSLSSGSGSGSGIGGTSSDSDAVSEYEKDPFIIAVACIFLASKNEDCIKKLRDIQQVANKIRDIDDQSDKGVIIDTQRRALMNIEFKLLQVIKFDFLNGSSMTTSVDQLVVQFSKKLGIDYINTMYSWLICFDVLLTPLCLMIPSHCIAMAIIIITLNVKPKEILHKYNRGESMSSSDLNEILERLDCYQQFRCPETLVNEGIIYILDYYVHNMNYLILNEFMPPVDVTTGKEQVFKFMDLKSRFNDLKILNEDSCNEKDILKQDHYLKPWDYSISLKGSSRFMLGNKRKRFDIELEFEKLYKKNMHQQKQQQKDNEENEINKKPIPTDPIPKAII